MSSHYLWFKSIISWITWSHVWKKIVHWKKLYSYFSKGFSLSTSWGTGHRSSYVSWWWNFRLQEQKYFLVCNKLLFWKLLLQNDDNSDCHDWKFCVEVRIRNLKEEEDGNVESGVSDTHGTTRKENTKNFGEPYDVFVDWKPTICYILSNYWFLTSWPLAACWLNKLTFLHLTGPIW